MIAGQTVFIGSSQYLVVNDHGTIESLPEMKWWASMVLWFATRRGKMGMQQVREYARSHMKRATP